MCIGSTAGQQYCQVTCQIWEQSDNSEHISWLCFVISYQILNQSSSSYEPGCALSISSIYGYHSAGYPDPRSATGSTPLITSTWNLPQARLILYIQGSALHGSHAQVQIKSSPWNMEYILITSLWRYHIWSNIWYVITQIFSQVVSLFVWAQTKTPHQYIEAETWPSFSSWHFSKQHFQIHFLEWKCMNSAQDITEVCS